MTARSKKTSEDQPTEPESFEEALERLEELVEELEGGNIPLEKSLQAFEEGQVLIKFCEKKLNAAEKMLAKLSQDAALALDDPASRPTPDSE
jgi:exodeoxyribonuclease VII small subunit